MRFIEGERQALKEFQTIRISRRQLFDNLFIAGWYIQYQTHKEAEEPLRVIYQANTAISVSEKELEQARRTRAELIIKSQIGFVIGLIGLWKGSRP